LVLATESGEPLLAWWRYGLGMTVAFTSDAKPRWAAEWLTWPGFGKFWAQVIRHAMRKSETKGSLVEVQRKGGQVTVALDAVDPAGQFINQADTELTLIDPGLGTRKLAMTQTAPGRYSAQFDASASGAYHLELAQKLGGQVIGHQSRGLTVGYSDELRLRPTDEALLRQTAELTGGVYNPAPADVFATGEQFARRATPLWPYLVMAALCIFVADVALRRIDFDLILGNFRRARRPAPA
jgi:hypothetical protein